MNEQNLAELYQEIQKRGSRAILNHQEQIDGFIGDSTDTRMGLTLVIRPTQEIGEKMNEIIRQLKSAEPDQYYYPQQDFHITLFDIITARQGFIYTKEQKENCLKLARIALEHTKPFHIKLKGIVNSEGAIMVKGFYDEEMEIIRQALRKNITTRNLALDERYPTVSSHITIARFRQEIKHREELLKCIDRYSNYEIGEFTVNQVDLICHNWYDSKKEVLETFHIVN